MENMETLIAKSQAWHDEQRRTIGSSIAAATFGEHEFITPLEAYQLLTGGDVPDISNKPDIIRGNLLEPIAAIRLEQTMGIKLVHHPQDQFLYNPKYPYAHCLPDYFIDGHQIIAEIKVPNPYTWERLADEIPIYIQSQLYHQLAITGAEAICLVALNPVNMEIFRQVYTPNLEIIDLLMNAEREFWEKHVIPAVPPDPQNESDLKLRWAEHAPGKRVTATEDIEIAWSELCAVRATVKHAEGRKEDLSLQIKAFMEDGEILIDQHGQTVATYRSHPHSHFDAKRFREAHPELSAAYTSEKVQRTFLVKEKRT